MSKQVREGQNLQSHATLDHQISSTLQQHCTTNGLYRRRASLTFLRCMEVATKGGGGWVEWLSGWWGWYYLYGHVPKKGNNLRA